MECDISAAILAGGSAKRMGGIIKPAIRVGGQPILARMLSVLNEVFSEVILVSNSSHLLSGNTGIKVATDVFKGKGPLGGIHSALLNSGTRAVFVFAGDMPLIDRSLILEQIGVFKKLDADILVPRTGELIEPLHAIYGKSVLQQLETCLSESKCTSVRDFLLHSNTSYFEPANQSVIKTAFLNINSPADIVIAEENLLKRFI